MKPRLLICTIVRDAAPHLVYWRSLLRNLHAYIKADYEVYLSVY